MLYADANQTECGTFLTQKVEDREAPIAFFSRTSNKTKYSICRVDCEMYSIFLTLKRFRHLVYGH